MSSKLSQIKKVLDLSKTQDFITSARRSADSLERIYNSSKTDDEKLVDMFNSLVSLGLYDVRDLPTAS